MKELVGLTNALMDIVIKVSDDELAELGFKKGAWNRQVNIDYAGLLALMDRAIYYPSGSPANTIFGAAKNGIKTALIGTIGNDQFGKDYSASLNDYGIENLLEVANGPTGICFILITPDGERTSTSIMGVAGSYKFDISAIEGAKVLHTSGYELRTSPARTLEVVNYAKSNGTVISYDPAGAEIIRLEKEATKELLKEVNILFVTEEEAVELTGKDCERALEQLALEHEIVVMKRGSRGSTVMEYRERIDIPAEKVKVVNTNGAGDGYAAGFLVGYICGLDAEECGIAGTAVAAEVIQMEGPHL